MLATLAAILPIFALVALGFAGRRSGGFGATSHAELSRFVVKLALPALLFSIMAEAKPDAVWQPGFIIAFGGSAAATFFVTMLVRRRRTVGSADAVADALAGAYSNTAFIGIPLCLALLGTSSLIATSIASIITICITFAIAILAIEIVLRPDVRFGPALATALLAAARNPMVFAPAAGALFSFGGLALPDPLRHFVDLLGAAASPCALVALGMFVGEKRPAVSGAATAQLVGLKLLFQPAIAWLIAYPLLALPPLWAKAAVLIAALPTGTGPFMLAELYRRNLDLTARVILVSTVVSIATLTLVMALL